MLVRILIVVIMGVIFWSCSPEPIEIKIDPIKPKLVVASQVIPGQLMVVALTRSFGALDFDPDVDSLSEEDVEQILVGHALVTISYSGLTDTLFKVEDGLYVSINTPRLVNQFYTLYVYDSVTGDEVSATTKMLPMVSFHKCLPDIYRDGDDTIVSVNIEVIDPPGENWYMVNYLRQNSADTVSGSAKDFFIGREKKNVYTYLYSDQLFEDDTIRGQDILWGMKPNDTLLVSVSNIRKEYFQFLDLRNRSENPFSQATNEPINYPTNVVNGYGFFNTHFPDMRIFDLSDFRIK